MPVRYCYCCFCSDSGKFDFEAMSEADRLWAPLIIFAFTLAVSFILINFFLIIIIEAFMQVRSAHYINTSDSFRVSVEHTLKIVFMYTFVA